jgi:hypothetical protein
VHATLEERTTVQQRRAVERAHNGCWQGSQAFWEEDINTCRDLFILLKHINNDSHIEPPLIKNISNGS